MGTAVPLGDEVQATSATRRRALMRTRGATGVPGAPILHSHFCRLRFGRTNNCGVLGRLYRNCHTGMFPFFAQIAPPPPHLAATRVGEGPKLDGKIDDAVWARAAP